VSIVDARSLVGRSSVEAGWCPDWRLPRCGLPVPETMISTVRPVASAMADRLRGGVVVKPRPRLVAGLVDEDDRAGWERAIHLTQSRISTRRLMTLLRLRSAALDFAVDGPGRWWFLGINPNGQWLWIEHATGLPIAAAIATALRLTSHPARPLVAAGPP
jgi:hypothetical protein